MLLLPATFDHLGAVGPLYHRFLFGFHPHNPGPPLGTYTHCHYSTNTKTLISRAILALLLLSDSFPPVVGTAPSTTLAHSRQWAVLFLGLNDVIRAYAPPLHTIVVTASLLPLPSLIHTRVRYHLSNRIVLYIFAVSRRPPCRRRRRRYTRLRNAPQ
jgi:hypothetical protein